MALDKTGTLTEGRMRLAACAVRPDTSQAELLRLAACVEAATRHPLADAVAAAAAAARVGPVARAADAITEPGCGVRGTVDGRQVAVGALGWVLARCGRRGVPVGSDTWTDDAGQAGAHAGVVVGAAAARMETCGGAGEAGRAASYAAAPRSCCGGAAAAQGPADADCALQGGSHPASPLPLSTDVLGVPMAERHGVAAAEAGTPHEAGLGAREGDPYPNSSPEAEAAEWEARADAAGLAGCTTVYVGEAGRGVLGALGFRDTLRPDAAATVARLRAMGLRVALLSGDNAAAAAAAAAGAGIPVRTKEYLSLRSFHGQDRALLLRKARLASQSSQLTTVRFQTHNNV